MAPFNKLGGVPHTQKHPEKAHHDRVYFHRAEMLALPSAEAGAVYYPSTQVAYAPLAASAGTSDSSVQA